jgi:hypothetical protein
MTSPEEPAKRLTAAENIRGWLVALAVSFGTALLVIAPFFWLGNASGHDFGFHASSWLDAAGQWREGIVYPRWTEWANHGFGEPRFIFYPPLSWMLGAALGLVLPWNAVPGVFIIPVQTLAGLCSFALTRRLLPVRAAVLAAALYAANPYALLNIYMRGDFAEQLGSAFFPLLLLMALELIGILGHRHRSRSRTIGLFAGVFAAVWLSNAPAGVLASYTVALLFAWGALTEGSWKPLFGGAAGLAVGFGLAGFYLLPAVYEQRWVNITQVLSSGLLPSENFLYTQIDDPEHTLFNWIASTVAILLTVMTAIASIAVHRAMGNREDHGERKKLWRVMLLLSLVAAILMIRPSSIVWEHLPKLRYVQFPWRWMALLGVPYAYFLGAAMPRRRSGWIWGVAVLAVIGGTATFLVERAWWDAEDIPVIEEAIANDQGFEGTDEYDPAGDDHYNLPGKAPRVEVLPITESEGRKPKAEIRIERWTAEERKIDVTSREPLRVALRLLDYPAWRVEVNGKAVTPEHAESSRRMVLRLPRGTERITAKFVRTTDRSLGMVISLMAGLALFGLWYAGRVRLPSANC